MSAYESPRGSNPGASKESVSSAHTHSATSPEILASAGRSDGSPCGTYYVLLCGDLSERLEDLADRRGMLLEDLAAELIEDGLTREAIIENLVNRGDRR